MSRLTRIEVLTPRDEPAMQAFLGRHIEHAMFLLSNLREAGFEDRGLRRSGIYVGAFEGDELRGVACHYRMGNVVVCAPSHAAELARAAVEASGWPLGGVVGPADEVAAAAAALGLDGLPMQLDESEGLYHLDLRALAIPQALRDDVVRGRPVAADDVELLTDWMVRYNVESVGGVETPELRERLRAEHVAAVGGDDVWVLEHDGQLVARTGFNARLPTVVQIGGVWTPHALRGRGFARCVIASHLLAVRAQGVDTAVLFTADANTPARRAYAALGFRAMGRYRLLILAEPQPPRA